MEFKNERLPNGLVLIGEVNRSAKSTAVGFFVKTGSRDEVPGINGVSHYLEHMLFKGTEKLSALEVNEAFDKTGAQFNAFTSEENTVFYAAILPEYLAEVTQLWADLMRPFSCTWRTPTSRGGPVWPGIGAFMFHLLWFIMITPCALARRRHFIRNVTGASCCSKDCGGGRCSSSCQHCS